ncbi:1,4-beta-xylanase [Brachybacterium phenoliresistens]|uniref:Beta-xylanase n=1 Tax=Brachybacterium phenoliresistens TaxID=396014 RepID=Z9JQQ5_9MICO|nr:1,4-beta-xylanase [Brachybacterium phenoliresistens]
MPGPTGPEGRVHDLALLVRRPDGAPAAEVEVRLEQRSHAFGFGCIAFGMPGAPGEGPGADAASAADADPTSPDAADATADAPGLDELWLDLFSMGTVPFYWRWYEPDPGSTGAAQAWRTVRWLREHGRRVKGHPLLWHTLAPPWLLDLDDDEVERTIRARIRREAGEFAGAVDEWDVINETVILPRFTAEENAVTRLARARGRAHVVAMAFETARQADPAARLVLNDFDLTPRFEEVIEELLGLGVPIDAIGLQTHMHQGYRGEEQIHEILERFSRFGLPLELTETTLVSGDLMPAHIEDLNDHQVPDWPSTPEGEARQADELVRHYRTVLAHPQVESLTYWGLGDEGAWLGAPAGLVRRDGTPKPSYEALRGLIRGQWWRDPVTVRTDAEGVLRFRGFAGGYRVEALGGAAEAQLDGAAPSATVTLG